MEFTTQGGPYQVYLITALLHINPKRIKRKNTVKALASHIKHKQHTPPVLAPGVSFLGSGSRFLFSRSCTAHGWALPGWALGSTELELEPASF